MSSDRTVFVTEKTMGKDLGFILMWVSPTDLKPKLINYTHGKITKPKVFVKRQVILAHIIPQLKQDTAVYKTDIE